MSSIDRSDASAKIAATVGLTVLEQAGLAMSDQLKSLGLVEYGDQFVVTDILAAD